MSDRLFPELTEEQENIILDKMKNFKGLVTTLEAAVGALVIGQQFGWRVLKMIHNPSTYRKYEQLLGIRFEEVCPERTPYSKRSLGLRVADKFESFWAVATGKKKVENKGVVVSQSEAEGE